ncbi:MAG: TlyA family RNA methyltransferase [Cyanobacteria bacterium P01_H01_bin.15]
MATKQRLDRLLVVRGLCESRQIAQRFIRAGEVRVNDQLIDKPGSEVPLDAEIVVKQKPRFVSRGGEKLIKALTQFELSIDGRICLDAGISTGGFTDCLLQYGAAHVYGIDVGYGQVAWSLRQDSRVTLKERTNFRYLQPQDLYQGPVLADLAVADLSFISLTKVLTALWSLLKFPRDIVLLVKPQFEVGRERIGKKGVVRDSGDQGQALFDVITAALNQGWEFHQCTDSPILGPAGNREFLVWFNQEAGSEPPSLFELKQFCRTLQTKT